MIEDNCENSIEYVSDEGNLLKIVTRQLEQLSSDKKWTRKLFILCFIPNILNGFHEHSYEFLGRMPVAYCCTNNEQVNNSNIPIITSGNDGCDIKILNYSTNSTENWAETPHEQQVVSCLSNADLQMEYEMIGNSVITEWNLICENSIWHEINARSLPIGQLLGILIICVVSDKYGRKQSYSIGACVFLVASGLCSFSIFHWSFPIGRFLLGFGMCGIFYPLLTMMTENVSNSKRLYMIPLLLMAQPLGMFYLVLSAHFFENWRELQLVLTLPAISLIFFLLFLDESPKWLVVNGRLKQACEILFGKNFDIISPEDRSGVKHVRRKLTLCSTLKTIFHEIRSIYGTSKQSFTIIVLQYILFISSLGVYLSQKNSANINVISVYGAVDVLAYLLAMALSTVFERRWTSSVLFGLSAFLTFTHLYLIDDRLISVIALLVRLCINSVYPMMLLIVIEVFPTEVRATALGLCAISGCLGVTIAPLIVDILNTTPWYLPASIVGVGIATCAILVTCLENTNQT